MHEIMLTVSRIAESIADAERKRSRLADFLKKLPDVPLRSAISPDPLLNLKVAAVDGGLVKKSLHGMDCVLARAAAACFHYRDGRVSEVRYFPSRNPAPRPGVYEALSEIDWNHFSALSRLGEEVRTAASCIEELKPDILLMDGMITPHYLDRPSKSSPLHTPYMNLLQSYKRLFKAALCQGVALAGIMEDSRSTLFCNFISESVLSKLHHPMLPEIRSLLRKTRDSNLLHLVLETGERSLSFPLEPPKDLDFDVPPMDTFYLKAARFDRPIKVDFLKQSVKEDVLAGILLAISRHHSGYGLPAPLIEADSIAKLSAQDMEDFYSSILSKAGTFPGTLTLRREKRPF